MDYVLIIALAALFYYIGNNDYYNKGWLLALLSVVFSYVGLASGLSIFGAFSANLLLYLILFVCNLFWKKPPGSQSGF
jgi:hypothetical protein